MVGAVGAPTASIGDIANISNPAIIDIKFPGSFGLCPVKAEVRVAEPIVFVGAGAGSTSLSPSSVAGKVGR
jgi:hypothetical protein